jgi:hypothetical protein
MAGGGNGVRYFKEDAFFKLISSGNKMLGDMAHQAITDIISQISSSNPISKLIQTLAPLGTSKNLLVRQRAAQYVEVLLEISPPSVIDSNSDLVDTFLISATQD